MENIGVTHFLRVFVIKLQFSACDSVCVSVEDPSPAALRRGWFGRDGREAGWFGRNSGDVSWLQRRVICALVGFLSPRSLTSRVSEEICGRFGSFDVSNAAYRASRLLADDLVNSFTVCTAFATL